jgi:acetylornithine deacetylase
MHETARILRDLVAIPSVNPMGRPLSGPDIYEHRLTDYLEAFFKGVGVAYERQTVAPRRDNIVAWSGPDDGRRALLFEAHQDTVPTDGMTVEPFAARIEGNRLYGRGACDVKGGMAAMLAAFTRFVVSQRPPDAPRLLMACTVDEEAGFTGVSKLVASEVVAGRRGPLEAVVAEPTGLRIVNAHKGTVRWDIIVTGRPCHSSTPEQGVNAVYHMAALLPVVEHYARRLQATKAHPVLGPATLSVGRIEGGVSVNTVPGACRVEVDRRLLPGEDADAALADFRDFLTHEAPAGVRWECSAPWLSAPALAPDGSGPLAARLGAVIDAVAGPHRVVGVPYGTDAAPLAAAGVPSVVFGPGDIGRAHTADEWVPLDEVEKAYEVLFRLASGR